MYKKLLVRILISTAIIVAVNNGECIARAGGAGGGGSSGGGGDFHSSGSSAGSFSHSSGSHSSSHSFSSSSSSHSSSYSSSSHSSSYSSSSHSSSYSSSSSSSSSSYLPSLSDSDSAGVIFYLFVITAFCGLAVWGYNAYRDNNKNFIDFSVSDFSVPRISSRSGNAPVTRSMSAKQTASYQKFISDNPLFDANQFLDKVRIAFFAVQEAWSVQNLASIRRYISDGIYQRFTTQFKMMSLLKQTNKVSNIVIESMQIAAAKFDGNYEVLDVQINASVDDWFVCELDHSLDCKATGERFTEYWSFIRKHSSKTSDSYTNNNCPNCGGTLPVDMGEVSQCSFCQAIVNNGTFDWILSEITQHDDYLLSNSLDTNKKLGLLNTFYEKYDDFSVQLIEDKAGNGFLQLMTACVTKDPSIFRRFVSDTAFEKLKQCIPEETIIYNRIYLNDVSVVGARSSKDQNILAIAVKKSSQRVKLNNDSTTQVIDPAIITSSHFILLSRSAQPSKNNGSLYIHRCPSCGAINTDTLEIHCSYCNSVLNDPKTEWIIEDILTQDEYLQYYQMYKKEFEQLINPKLIDETYNARDYALNNIMMIIAADGKYDQSEREMIELLAKKWNYEIEKIEPLFSMANSGRLSLRMPENSRERRKVMELMGTLAGADGKITKEEWAILENVRQQYFQCSVKQ